MSSPNAPRPTDHDHLRFALMSAGQRVWDAQDEPERFHETRDDLVKFCITQLVPHLERDERRLLTARHGPAGGLLAQAMTAEIRTMKASVYELSTTTRACEAMALTRVLHTFLAAHDHHEKLLLTESSGSAARRGAGPPATQNPDLRP